MKKYKKEKITSCQCVALVFVDLVVSFLFCILKNRQNREVISYFQETSVFYFVRINTEGNETIKVLYSRWQISLWHNVTFSDLSAHMDIRKHSITAKSTLL